MSSNKKENDFSQETKAKKRAERYQQGGTNGGVIEVHHIKPKYAGGSADEENGIGVTRPEHANAHFTHAHDPKPGEKPAAEWSATRHVINRMNLDEFTDFLGLVEPLIPQLREELQEKRQKRVKKLP